jgi:hypothetical protein
MKIAPLSGLVLALLTMPVLAQAPQAPARNIIIFVADGLRYGSVTKDNMPNMYKLKTEGVDFTNSHSLFPTITMVNASAIATGHYVGDTGNFGNTLHTATPMQHAKGGTVVGLRTTACWRRSMRNSAQLPERRIPDRARPHAGLFHRRDRQAGAGPIADSTAAADGSQTLILGRRYRP